MLDTKSWDCLGEICYFLDFLLADSPWTIMDNLDPFSFSACSIISGDPLSFQEGTWPAAGCWLTSFSRKVITDESRWIWPTTYWGTSYKNCGTDRFSVTWSISQKNLEPRSTTASAKEKQAGILTKVSLKVLFVFYKPDLRTLRTLRIHFLGS